MQAVAYPTSSETSPSLAAIVAAVDCEDLAFREQTSPDGSLTVVFTDIEGSSAMLEALGEDRWLELIREHNRLLRDGVADYGGRVVEYQGDGFMVVFDSASAALGCSVALQRAFDAYNDEHPDEQLRVRIGLHTGNVFQEKDEFLGRTVIVAARITGRARGGEVLVSSKTRDYTAHLGQWRFGPAAELELRGLSTAQRVHALDWRAGGT